eukprot:15464132-Alexandrium_andersonii.AAC.1
MGVLLRKAARAWVKAVGQGAPASMAESMATDQWDASGETKRSSEGLSPSMPGLECLAALQAARKVPGSSGGSWKAGASCRASRYFGRKRATA